MIDWKLHFIFGLLLVIALLAFFQLVQNLVGFQLSLQDIAIVLVLVSFSTLFPDIDMQKSKIRDMVSFASAITVSIIYLAFLPQTWYYAAVYFLLAYFILRYLPTKHRGIVHTFKFSIFFSFLAVLICYMTIGSTIGSTGGFAADRLALYFSAALLGYNLHLILDKA